MTVEASSIPNSGQRFILHGVDWQFYEQVLSAVGDRCGVFVTFDQGSIELMSPSWKHERRGAQLGKIIEFAATALAIDFICGRSTTFRRRDLEKGLEPDNCYYIGDSVRAVVGNDEIDLSIDPPPDLAIEVEISTRLLKREQIYAAIGANELWRDDGEHLQVYQLSRGKYRQVSQSSLFPTLPLDLIDGLLARLARIDDRKWNAQAARWVRKNIVKS